MPYTEFRSMRFVQVKQNNLPEDLSTEFGTICPYTIPLLSESEPDFCSDFPISFRFD